MRIKSTSLFALVGMAVLCTTACDTGASEESSDNNAVVESSEASKSNDEGESIDYRSAGALARGLSLHSEDHCAFYVGECLHATQRCSAKDDGTCAAGFQACRDSYIVESCNTDEDLDLSLNTAKHCWNNFDSCAADERGVKVCNDALSACLVADFDCGAASGCEGGGCELGLCEPAKWPTRESAWPAQGEWPEDSDRPVFTGLRPG